MIYVAVGTQKFQFNRLLSKMDKLIADGLIDEEVFAQIGYSDYKPQNYRFKDFLSKDEYDTWVKKCDLLITHGGVATIMEGLQYNKPVIVVPRLSKYDEHVDNHQIQIAEAFSSQNFVLMCDENADIGKIIEQARVHSFSKYVSKRAVVTKTIRDFLSSVNKQKIEE